jgi:ligand-binding SRPBCC domain-containing protein
MPTVFHKRSVMATTMERMMAFHNHPRAFNRLTPPPIFVQVLRDGRKSLTEGEVEFRLWFGFVPSRWRVRHEAGSTPTSFVDRMLEGPVQSWEHQHVFEEVAGGVALIDHLTIEHKPGLAGLVTRVVFGRLALEMLFVYRHWRTWWGVRGVKS